MAFDFSIVLAFVLLAAAQSLPTKEDLVKEFRQPLFKSKKWERANRQKLIMPKDSVRHLGPFAPEIDSIKESDIPSSFDWRLQASSCASLSQIRDQRDCGSCWAVSSASVISDRTCINSGGSTQFVASADDIMSCCPTCNVKWCEGGVPVVGFKFWNTHGVVSGGDFNSSVGCKPYPESPDTPSEHACQSSCVSGYPLTYQQDKHFGSSYYELLPGAVVMQKEILANGPVVACFQFWDDFYDYKSGVYVKTATAKHDGMHCIKIYGWGTENGTPYWLGANSWGLDWGENGFFKFIRGIDECGIEAYAAAGHAK